MEHPDNPVAEKPEPTRRTFLQWLGTGTVLTLAQAVACSSPHMQSSDIPDAGSDAEPDVPPDADAITDAGPDSDVTEEPTPEPSENFPFEPGEPSGPLFRTWPERTVDPQDPASILLNWRLRVDGLVARPRTFRFDELVNLQQLDLLMDFHCVEGWSILDVPWNGLHMSTLWDLVEPLPEATYVTFHTLGGTYNESLPMEVANEPNTLLAYGINGFTIPLKHGFPLRLVIPRLLAYKSAKYVERIELTTEPVFGFWVQRGYPYDAPVHPSRLREGRY